MGPALPHRAGEWVIVSNPAANRHPRVVEDPERLDLSRPPTPHLAFGHGAHHCTGAQLARMELQVGLRALLDRCPGAAAGGGRAALVEGRLGDPWAAGAADRLVTASIVRPLEAGGLPATPPTLTLR